MSNGTELRRPRSRQRPAVRRCPSLALVVALTAVIYWTGRGLGVQEFPIVVALLFALVIAMPLGIWLFAPLRRRATAGIDAATERRRRDREQLRARLRGEAPPDDRPPTERGRSTFLDTSLSVKLS